MKYIRTKDEIYEIDNDKYSIVELNGHKLLNIQVNEFGLIKREYILKQSDTIKELCDLIVKIENGKYSFGYLQLYLGEELHFVEYNERKLEESVELEMENTNALYYGAIWTEWGLKYVAKMNSGGGLELI